MKKILHFVHWPRTGITSLLNGLFATFDVAAFENHLFVLDAVNEDLQGIAPQVRGAQTGGQHGVFSQVAGFRSFLREVRADLIHTHSLTPTLVTAALCAKYPHVRTIHSAYPYFTEPGTRARAKRAGEKWALDRPGTHVICVSQGVAGELPYRFSRAQLSTIDNGLDASAVMHQAGERRSKRDLFGVSEEVTVLLSVGRLEPQKGYDLLLEALAELEPRKQQSLLLVLLGEGAERSALQSLTRKLALEGSVRFLGFKENPFPYVRSADLYISSSRYEGYGLSLDEALILGLPVITTRVSGVAERIVDGQTGIVAESATPAALRHSLERLLDDHTLAERIAAAGQRMALEQLGIARTTRAYSDLYRSILQ